MTTESEFNSFYVVGTTDRDAAKLVLDAASIPYFCEKNHDGNWEFIFPSKKDLKDAIDVVEKSKATNLTYNDLRAQSTLEEEFTLIGQLLSLAEAKVDPTHDRRTSYQVKIGGTWKDIKLSAESIDDIAKALSAPVHDDAVGKGHLHEITEFIEDFIGHGPNGYRHNHKGSDAGHWDDIDIEVISNKHDTLKLSYHFKGVKEGPWEHRGREVIHGTPVTKSGTVTILPALSKDSIAEQRKILENKTC